MSNTRFTKYITTRNGKKIYAESYGLKVFPLKGKYKKIFPEITEKKEPTK